MRNCAVSFIAILALLASMASATAGPLDSGNQAYESGDYATAVADYQSAVKETHGAEQAKADYKLGLSYHKLHEDSQAVQAFTQAQAVDPTLSFASSPDKFQSMLARSESHASGGGSSAAAPLTSNGAGDNAQTALVASNVYVDPSMKSVADASTLEQAAQDNSHTIIKIAVLPSVPRGEYSSVTAYCDGLHQFLNLGNAGLIVFAAGNHGGVADSSKMLTTSEAQALAQKYVARIQAGDYNGGIAAMASDMASQIDAKERRGPDMILILFLIVIAVIGFLLYSASRRKKAELSAMRIPLNTELQQVLQNIQYLDNYADVLPKNNANSDQVRAYRQAAEAKYEQADKIMVKATDTAELTRAQSLLDRAMADLRSARKYLDLATGGTSAIPGDEAIRPEPIPADQHQVDSIPTAQRGVSFFSSQPAPISGLVPVTLNIDGVDRQVMATPEEADSIRRGQIPAIRSFNVNGQSVPWYAYQSYDPYRDYWQYQNNGWGGFGSGAVAGFIGAELLDDIFRPRSYGWTSPYGYAPGFDSFGGWGGGGYGGYNPGFNDGFNFNDGGMNAGNYAFQDQNMQSGDPGGGASFFGGGGGYDQSDYGQSGGGASNFGGDRS